MFTVMYKGQVKPGKEDAYKRTWQACAQYFVDHYGALGSTLYKSEQGEWIALSKWPDKATRERVWNAPDLPLALQKRIDDLKACLESYSELNLEKIAEVTKN